MVSAEGTVKLIDFGLATKISREGRLSAFAGTPGYMAPEIEDQQMYCGDKQDIWYVV